MSVKDKLGELWDRLKGKGPAAAVALSLDLGDARDNKPVSIEAGGLVVERCDGDLYARINGPNGDGVNLRHVRRIVYPINALYLTNAAQAGLVARILLTPVGMDARPAVDRGGDFQSTETPVSSWDCPAGVWEVYAVLGAGTEVTLVRLSDSQNLGSLGRNGLGISSVTFPVTSAVSSPGTPDLVTFSTAGRGWLLTGGLGFSFNADSYVLFRRVG